MGEFFNISKFDMMNEGAEGGGSGGGSTAGQENVSHQNLVNVSCSQVAKFTRKEEGLVIFRQKIHSIIAQGVVVSIEELTTKNIYVITDYTIGGPIEVQLWKNDTEGTGNVQVPPTIMERTYIRVIGQVRYDDRKPFIVAFRVEPIEDPNDIYLHQLKVIHDSMFLEKRMNATLNDPVNISKPSTTSFESSAPGMGGGFTNIQKGVMNVLNNQGRDSPYGLKRYEIRNYMPGVNPSMIDEAINFLVNEGHIFSTTDENTFKSINY